MLNMIYAYFLMVVVSSELIGNISRCPSKMERRHFGSHRSCLNNDVYHCIKSDQNELVETCNEKKRIPKGNYPIYLHKSDQIFYQSCPNSLYQPLSVWSSEISDCEYKKSACNEIGQVMCDIGNASEDATCGCDYNRGYGRNDIKCIDVCLPGFERSAHNPCKPKSTCNTTWSSLPKTVSTTRAPILLSDKVNRYRTNQFTIIWYSRSNVLGFCAIAFMMKLVMINVLISVTTTKWTFSCLNYILATGFSLLMSFLIACFTVWHMTLGESFAYAFALIVTLLMCTTCYLVYSLYEYEIITDPEVCNEEYDKRIFRLLEAASKGDVNEIKRLRHERYIDMDDVDINGRSALHIAACSNQRKTVEYMINKFVCYPEAKDRWNRSAKDDAKWHNDKSTDSYDHTIKLLSSYSDLHYRKKEWKKKKFFKETKAMELVTAANKGDICSIKRLHERKTDMNLANSIGRTALHAAVANGSTNIVEYLIDFCEVSPFVRWSGRRPIDIIPTYGQDGIEAMSEKLQDYMSYLLEYTPEDVPVEEMMIVRLLNCASRGDIKQMKRFKAAGCQMNIRNYDLQTALHIAVMENQEYIVDFLLKECKQTDIALKAEDRWNITPWEAAKKSALQSVKYVFFDNCPETLEEENEAIKTFNLLEAARKGNLETLKSLQRENFDMNKQDHNGKTALHMAASANKAKAVKFLVDVAKVDIFIPDRYNLLPMDGNIPEKIKDIIKNYQNDTKKEQNEISTQEDTLMLVMKACSNGILHKQKDPRYKYFNTDNCNYNGDTPLHIAAANGKLEDVIHLLDELKAGIFVRNSFWQRPIDMVEEKLCFWKKRISQSCNKTMIEQLEKIKVQIEKATQKALDQLTDIDKDASFEKRSKEERLFLFQIRVFRGDILAIRRFLKTDATLINQLDYDDRSALHIAAAAGHTHLVEFLLNQEADKNKKDRYNMTPLDEAKMNGDDKMIHMLKG